MVVKCVLSLNTSDNDGNEKIINLYCIFNSQEDLDSYEDTGFDSLIDILNESLPEGLGLDGEIEIFSTDPSDSSNINSPIIIPKIQ